MVYCGKPSKGCLACRSRKTRCDRQTPACSQCIRAKRECPGYRNQLDLMFRNESQAVIGKVHTQKLRKKKSSPTNSNPAPISSSPSRSSRDQSPARTERSYEFFQPLIDEQAYVPDGLSPSLEDRALNFYKNRSAIWLRNLDIVEIITGQGQPDDYLLSTLTAVGLASYASSVRSTKLMFKARKDYGKALQLTNAALRSPTKYTTDSTLFSVLALGVFEAVAGNGEESLSAWGKHLAGASELVKLRGMGQFATEAGRRMFLQIGSNLMVDCVQHGKPIPDHILAFRKASEPFIDVQEPAWRISSTIVTFTNLRARILNDKKNCNPRQIVREALEIDDIYSDIEEKLPPLWRYKTIRSDENPDAIWNGVYHVYTDMWMAQMLNTMRVFRIHVLQILREQLEALNPDLSPVFSTEETTSLTQRVIKTMLEMQAQILASAPQYVRWGVNSFPTDQPYEPADAYQILWPLFLVGNMDITSPQVSRWVMNRYLVIAKEASIEHAAVFAESMRKRHNTDANEQANDLAQPLKLDPFDWNLDGWVLAHGVILSAQVNKPKILEQSKPRMTPPPGWTGGPPPGWVGGPPPGWKGGPPPDLRDGVSNKNPMSPPSISPGLQGVPPPGWVGGPPPGWKGGPPSNTKDGVSKKTSTSSSVAAPGLQGGPPPGWTGPPPPGWPGKINPSASIPVQGSSRDPSMPSPQNMSNSPADIPPHFSGPPPGWVGPPPPGWPGVKTQSSDGTPSTSNNFGGVPAQPPVNTQKQQFGPPPGWTGPPPPGWNPSLMMSAQKSPGQNLEADLSTKHVSPPSGKTSRNVPPAGFSGPPPGWSGPPPDWMTPSFTVNPQKPVESHVQRSGSAKKTSAEKKLQRLAA